MDFGIEKELDSTLKLLPEIGPRDVLIFRDKRGSNPSREAWLYILGRLIPKPGVVYPQSNSTPEPPLASGLKCGGRTRTSGKGIPPHRGIQSLRLLRANSISALFLFNTDVYKAIHWANASSSELSLRPVSEGSVSMDRAGLRERFRG